MIIPVSLEDNYYTKKQKRTMVSSTGPIDRHRSIAGLDVYRCPTVYTLIDSRSLICNSPCSSFHARTLQCLPTHLQRFSPLVKSTVSSIFEFRNCIPGPDRRACHGWDPTVSLIKGVSCLPEKASFNWIFCVFN